jgi:hypothetical protein
MNWRALTGADGTVCVAGTCKTGGGLNQPCCQGDVCNGSACSSGSYVACGGPGPPCCGGERCSGSLASCESGVLVKDDVK